MSDGTRKSIANELTEYLLFEITKYQQNGEKSSSCLLPLQQHALEQLVESKMGSDVTEAAERICRSPERNIFEIEAVQLMESSSFEMLRDAIQDLFQSLQGFSDCDRSSEGTDLSSVKIESPQRSQPAPTTFSLFDMLDAQKGAFNFSPRITADMVIKANQNANQAGKHHNSLSEQMITDDSQHKSSLELLEISDDIDDLSPDPDTWDEICQILYHGLMSFDFMNEKNDHLTRYFVVHKALYHKCRHGYGGLDHKFQLWGLTQNLVGAILTYSTMLQEKLPDSESDTLIFHQFIDFYWDIVHEFLTESTHLALECIKSCVGNEKEIERMLLGMSFLLANDVSACIIASIEPMAGWFEVWARFISPKKMLMIVQSSMLGGAVLQRCLRLGSNDKSKRLAEILKLVGRDDGTLVANLDHCNFLQSMHVLRTILLQCGGSPYVLSMIHQQSLSTLSSAAKHSPLHSMMPRGIFSTDCVQSEFKKLEDTQHCSVALVSELPDALKRVMKPFHDILFISESRSGMIDSQLRNMCTETVQFFKDMENEYAAR